MPNNVINELRIDARPMDVLAMVIGKNRAIDFSVLLPLPLHFWPGSVNTSHEKTLPGTHLDAAINIWGTKWNAYGLSDSDEGPYQSVTTTEDSVTLIFETAWSPPMGWIVALFNTFQTTMKNTWLDEGREAAQVDSFNWSYLDHMGAGEAWKRSDVDEETQR